MLFEVETHDLGYHRWIPTTTVLEVVSFLEALLSENLARGSCVVNCFALCRWLHDSLQFYFLFFIYFWMCAGSMSRLVFDILSLRGQNVTGITLIIIYYLL